MNKLSSKLLVTLLLSVSMAFVGNAKTAICYTAGGQTHYLIHPNDLDCEALGTGDCGCITDCWNFGKAPNPYIQSKLGIEEDTDDAIVLSPVDFSGVVRALGAADDVIASYAVAFDAVDLKVSLEDIKGLTLSADQLMNNSLKHWLEAEQMMADILVTLQEGGSITQSEVNMVEQKIDIANLTLALADEQLNRIQFTTSFVIVEALIPGTTDIGVSEVDQVTGTSILLFTISGGSAKTGAIADDKTEEVEAKEYGIVNIYQNRPDISVYPNPFKETITFNMDRVSSTYTITLWNSLGQIVLRKNTTDNNVIMRTDELGKGVYYYKLTSQGEVINTGKLIHE